MFDLTLLLIGGLNHIMFLERFLAIERELLSEYFRFGW